MYIDGGSLRKSRKLRLYHPVISFKMLFSTIASLLSTASAAVVSTRQTLAGSTGCEYITNCSVTGKVYYPLSLSINFLNNTWHSISSSSESPAFVVEIVMCKTSPLWWKLLARQEPLPDSDQTDLFFALKDGLNCLGVVTSFAITPSPKGTMSYNSPNRIKSCLS